MALTGQHGQVTIATNMAGRGTDVRLGTGVAELGGLHVLGTSATRHGGWIANWRDGPVARAIRAVASSFYPWRTNSWLEGLGPGWQAYLRERGQRGGPINWQLYHRLFLRAQKRMERRHRRQRIDLLYYEKYRQEVLKDLSADPYVD